MSSRLVQRLQKHERERAARVTRQSPDDVLASLIGALHPKERGLVDDPARFITAVCSRRAGKTTSVTRRMLKAIRRVTEADVLYLTRTRRNSKRIVWGPLKKIARLMGGEPNETDLVITFPWGNHIYVDGVNDRSKVEDYRGFPLSLVVCDETQNFPAYIEDLINDALIPALQDYDGAVVLAGTPGPVPKGYFYDASHSDEWSPHAWTAWDNPSLDKTSKKTAEQRLSEEMKRRGVTRDDPSIQREWFGKWVVDPSSLVWRLDGDRARFTELPKKLTPWRHVIAIDIGFEDADAIVALAFHADDPAAYVVEEWVGRRQLISDLARRVAEMRQRLGNVVAIVMDEGGLGKKIGEELRQRFALPIQPAQKTEKVGFIELVNDAARTGRLKFQPGSPSVEDARMVEWDNDRSTPDKRVISDRFHSDVLDALTYGFRECRQWMHVEKQPPPKANTLEWAVAEAAAMRKAAERRAQRAQRARSWER